MIFITGRSRNFTAMYLVDGEPKFATSTSRTETLRAPPPIDLNKVISLLI